MYALLVIFVRSRPACLRVLPQLIQTVNLASLVETSVPSVVFLQVPAICARILCATNAHLSQMILRALAV